MSDYRALYRKWRPFDFDDVSGQKAVTDILKYEVAENKLSHAYLFCGSRGTGKTSCAKILAKAVNCLRPRSGNPCNECEACRSIDRGIATDVIEMDAASNNGVDNVRDLKDEITFTPALLKYRVYIIDEVHMMSSAAFNALLKTLEEPPTYVIFILATTEFNKLPTTIVSRCQRFDFKRMTSDVIVDRITHIANAEGIDLTPDGARVIARAAQGGMRDAVSLLELCAGARTKIDADLVSATVGTGNREHAYSMIESLSASDYSSVYSIIHSVVMSSADLSVFWMDLIEAYRDMMVAKTSKDAKSYLDLTDTEYERLKTIGEKFTMSKIFYHTSLMEEALADMQRALNAKRSIAEIALTRMCDPKLVLTPMALAVRVEELEKQLSMIKLGVVNVSGAKDAKQQETNPNSAEHGIEPQMTVSVPSEKNTAVDDVSLKSAPQPYKRWGQVVERIGELKRSLSVQFISAECFVTDGVKFTVTMSPFFAKRLSASETDLSILRGVIAECEGRDKSEISLCILEKGSEVKNSLSDELDAVFH